MADVEDALGKRVDMYEVAELKENSPVFNALKNDAIVIYDRGTV